MTMGGWYWKAVYNGISFMIEKISALAGLKLETTRPVGQHLTYSATGSLSKTRKCL